MKGMIVRAIIPFISNIECNGLQRSRRTTGPLARALRATSSRIRDQPGRSQLECSLTWGTCLHRERQSIERTCFVSSRNSAAYSPRTKRAGRSPSAFARFAPRAPCSAAYSAHSRRYALSNSAFMLTPVIRCGDFDSSAPRDGYAAGMGYVRQGGRDLARAERSDRRSRSITRAGPRN
jgi:hypothetical protein